MRLHQACSPSALDVPFELQKLKDTESETARHVRQKLYYQLAIDACQESAAFLLHPESPTQRLLVDHATGTGKASIFCHLET